MNNIINNLYAINYDTFWIVLAFCLSAFISYNSYPIIIKISKLKELMHEPSERCSHLIKTPNLGGIGVFLGVTAVLTFIGSILSYNNLLCIIGALVVLFFTGIKDDLIEISPINKFIGQLIAVFCVIIINDIRIYSLFGLFGIEVLPYAYSVILTLFGFIFIINAFNLIDGVDGLAGSLALVASILFGVFFHLNGNDSLFFISLSLIGTLVTFLIFNFSKEKKIFMGDTGAMIIGFLLAYQGVSFLQVTNTTALLVDISKPTIVIAIFSFPIMDTTRVFILRMMKGKSPFSADKSHIHHNLLLLGCKHWEISLIASVFILTITRLTYSFAAFGEVSLLFLILISGACSVIPFLLVRMKQVFNGEYSIDKLNKYLHQLGKKM